ncbi:CBS domain-containing protein [Mucilaginibacter sp. cycad4]|uniref:CBS domain-containing protein n=1 Tax=Mucilaginibacter sp. cycad4 TaxID=3342096 RepID=UPI002AABF14D|nr:CBS domain-containing protein [Mucilaginibacter gossypii]WPV01957.1 CBS domain-containing protein [Mucilaginibacter gossypii]
MSEPKSNFEEILADVRKTQKPVRTFPYIATQYLNVSRRGWRVIKSVNDLLEKYELICEPEFGSAWFYGEIEIKPKPKVGYGKSDNSVVETDPTPRLSLLKAANLNKVKELGTGNGLISVNRNTTVIEATTLMIMHSFSQLPILNNQRDVDGIVSWKSIGRALALGKSCTTVSDCKEDVTILDHDELLFNAVKFVLEEEVVLVRQKDRTISGIVTATDIGEQFISMAEPFLIIEQIENHIRKMLGNKFEKEDLIFSEKLEEKSREINNISDLTFGQYVKLMEDPKKFEKLKINVDRGVLAKQLEEVRKIRNDVMHFNTDGINSQNLELLRQTVNFLHVVTSTLKT